MKTAEIRKQISIFVPLSDWRMIRQEAARLKIPMTELCRRWMKPALSQLKRQQQAHAERIEAICSESPPNRAR